MKKKEKLKGVGSFNFSCILTPIKNPIRSQLINNNTLFYLGGDATGCSESEPSYNSWGCIVDTRTHSYNDNNSYNGFNDTMLGY